MLWYFVIGVLAAFGALCALWVTLGALLPGGRCRVIVCVCKQEHTGAVRRRYRWLWELGLVKGSAVILTDTPGWREKLEQEFEGIGAAGNGDPPGHHRGGGVPEL